MADSCPHFLKRKKKSYKKKNCIISSAQAVHAPKEKEEEKNQSIPVADALVLSAVALRATVGEWGRKPCPRLLFRAERRSCQTRVTSR